jgi:hypothetical protein
MKIVSAGRGTPPIVFAVVAPAPNSWNSRCVAALAELQNESKDDEQWNQAPKGDGSRVPSGGVGSEEIREGSGNEGSDHVQNEYEADDLSGASYSMLTPLGTNHSAYKNLPKFQ